MFVVGYAINIYALAESGNHAQIRRSIARDRYTQERLYRTTIALVCASLEHFEPIQETIMLRPQIKINIHVTPTKFNLHM